MTVGSLERRRVTVDAWAVALPVLVFAAALLPRMLYLYWAPVFIGGDSLQYYQPVHDYLSGNGFTLSLKRPPAYSAMVIAIQSVLGTTSFVPIIGVQHLMGAMVVLMTYAIGVLVYGRGVAVASALIGAICGPMMRWEHFLMSEALFTFTFILATLLVVVALKRGGVRWWAAAGLAIGLSILTRSAGQILLFVVPPALLLIQRSWRRVAVASVVLYAACAVVTVPWMLRNLAVHGAFTTAGAAGQNLVTFAAIIHRPNYSFEDPLVVAVDADPRRATARRIIQKAMDDKLAKPQLDVTGLGIHNRIMEETKLSQAQADAAMRDIALRAIMSRPLTYAQDTLIDVVKIFRGSTSEVDESLRYHWDLWQSRGWRGPMARYLGPASPRQEAAFDNVAFLDGLYHPSHYWLLLAVLFLAGTALAAVVPSYRVGLVLAISAVALIGISAGTVGAVPRYRLPPDPLINLVAISAVGWAVGWVTARLPRASAAA